MILRTILIIGFGAAQPVGLPSTLAMAAFQAPMSDSPAGPAAAEAVGKESAEPDSSVSLAREFASWRADRLTRSDDPEALVKLRALIVRAESLARSHPEEAQPAALLAGLYRQEFEEAERRLGVGELRVLFLRRLTQSYSTAGGAGESAIGEASASVITADRIEALLGTAIQEAGIATSGPEDRRRLGPRAQMIAAAVADAVAGGDDAFIAQLGTAAVPELTALAAKLTGDRHRGSGLDPLLALSQVDPAAALDVALAHCRTGDLLLKLRVIDAFAGEGPFGSMEVWRPIRGGRAELVDPDWAEIVESFYTVPAAPTEVADRYLLRFVQWGYAPGRLEGLVPDLLARRSLGEGVVHPVAASAARLLVERGDSASMLAGVKVLLRATSTEPLYGLAGSLDPVLRASLARAFGPRTVGHSVIVPEIDAGYREALGAFLTADVPEPEVGTGVQSMTKALELSAKVAEQRGKPVLDSARIQQVLNGPQPLSAGAFLALVQHVPTLEVRDQRGVIGLLSSALLRFAGAAGEPWGDAWVGAAQALLVASDAASGGDALVDVFEESADVFGWRALVELKREESGYSTFSPAVKELEPIDQLRVIRSLWRVGYDNFVRFDDGEVRLRREHWLEIVGDERLPSEARAWALEAMTDVVGPPVRGAASTVAQAVAAIGSCPIAARDLTQMGIDPEAYLEALLDIPGAPDSALLSIWVPLNREGLAERMLERFPPATWKNHSGEPALSGLISALAKRRDPAVNSQLLEANIARTAIQSYLISALDRERFEGHLAVGGAVLKAGNQEQDTVIAYVASFATDEAARYLIEAMESARSEFYRDQLFAALQKMTERREASDRWTRSRSAEERRGAAVAKLVEVITSPSSKSVQVVEAIRSLGLLDAREELPRLVELLASEDEALREAAQAAIDRMDR